MPHAFKHLCTVEGDPDGQAGSDMGQAHRNTITSLCIVPFRDNANQALLNDLTSDYTGNDTGTQDARLGLSASKKIFSSSLDSTIKCWHFKPLSSEGRNQAIAANGQAIRQNDYMQQPAYYQHDLTGTGSNQ